MKEAFPVGYAQVKSAELLELDGQLKAAISNHPDGKTLLPPADLEHAARTSNMIAQLGINFESEVSRSNMMVPNVLQSAFYRGTMAGLYLGRLVFPEVVSLQFCLQQLVNEVRDAKSREPHNEAYAAERLLTELGSCGLGKIVEARNLVDTVIEPGFSDPSQALSAKIGFGVGILVYQESAGQEADQAAAAAIAQHADTLRYADDEAFAAGLAALLPPTEDA